MSVCVDCSVCFWVIVLVELPVFGGRGLFVFDCGRRFSLQKKNVVHMLAGHVLRITHCVHAKKKVFIYDYYYGVENAFNRICRHLSALLNVKYHSCSYTRS